jgi:hypothetical protein
VFGLAAVLIALELPASIHRRLNRNGRRPHGPNDAP